MICTFTHEDEKTNEVWIVAIDFKITAGEPMGVFYPGSPAELEITRYRVKEWQKYDGAGTMIDNRVNVPPRYSKALDTQFEAMVDKDRKLCDRIEAACFAEAEGQFDRGE